MPRGWRPRRTSSRRTGKVSVDGHDRQQPNTGEHGDILEEVSGLAHPESVRPVVQHVDGSLERYAEYQEQQIRTAEVQDKHPGCVQPVNTAVQE
ncbi:hypothetical protein T4C_9222 [Trichinella pseudospiralis]|uniref:Uncharacterized protein n=1 Tax=Trichinella pseudospiralis TaxID=6337 RepID=A0A0V1KG71_TRIPS|nr:hypothetical protein T4C_9222 [Trichinella pseudospiralis]